jgi:hypothetical protein
MPLIGALRFPVHSFLQIIDGGELFYEVVSVVAGLKRFSGGFSDDICRVL